MTQQFQNVEIKARLAAPYAKDDARLGVYVHTLVQSDEYYETGAERRVKLRRELLQPRAGLPAVSRTAVIEYARPDVAGTRQSEVKYTAVLPGRDEDTAIALRVRYGQPRTIVAKTRRLYMRGRTRVHVDTVEGLGDFLELETVLRPGEPLASGEDEAWAIATELGILSADLIAGSYSDMRP